MQSDSAMETQITLSTQGSLFGLSNVASGLDEIPLSKMYLPIRNTPTKQHYVVF